MTSDLGYWKEGQEVVALRVVKRWPLSKRDAEEMNEGENPLYPWQVDLFQRSGGADVSTEKALLQTVAEAVGLDASQGAILHRSHRRHWEIHGRFHDTRGRTIMREVSCVPWEGLHARVPDDTHNGIQYVPALEGVEDPDRALEVIATHMKVGAAARPPKEVSDE